MKLASQEFTSEQWRFLALAQDFPLSGFCLLLVNEFSKGKKKIQFNLGMKLLK